MWVFYTKYLIILCKFVDGESLNHFSNQKLIYCCARFVIGQYVTVHGDVISHVNISHVMVEDGGEYSCTAENRAGKVTHAARLNVYGAYLLLIIILYNVRQIIINFTQCSRSKTIYSSPLAFWYRVVASMINDLSLIYDHKSSSRINCDMIVFFLKLGPDTISV